MRKRRRISASGNGQVAKQPQSIEDLLPRQSDHERVPSRDGRCGRHRHRVAQPERCRIGRAVHLLIGTQQVIRTGRLENVRALRSVFCQPLQFFRTRAPHIVVFDFATRAIQAVCSTDQSRCLPPRRIRFRPDLRREAALASCDCHADQRWRYAGNSSIRRCRIPRNEALSR